jgi:hypothetical protein
MGIKTTVALSRSNCIKEIQEALSNLDEFDNEKLSRILEYIYDAIKVINYENFTVIDD